LDHTVSFAVSTVQGIGTLVFLPIIAPYKVLSLSLFVHIFSHMPVTGAHTGAAIQLGVR
jgi:hypothetical protein